MSSGKSNSQREAIENVKNYFIRFFLHTNEFYMHKKTKNITYINTRQTIKFILQKQTLKY